MEDLEQRQFCNYCLQQIKSYRYRCLECYRYDLCCPCFHKRKWNEQHERSHVVARLCHARVLSGLRFEEDELDLENMSQVFAGETHTNHECKICHCTPIVGLRLKCDYCFDFNICFDCRKKHGQDHPLLVYGKTVPMEIPIPTDVEMLDASTARYHDQVCTVTRINSQDLDAKMIIREQEAYSEINGANLLKMVGYFFDSDLVVLMPLMEKGNLRDLLENEPGLEPWRRLSIAADIASGVMQIHILNRVHRDIRAKNIYIDGEHRAKIACDPQAIIERDPEENENYDKKRDVIHLGLLLNQLFGGNHSYDVKLRQYRVIKCEAMFWELISSCLDPQPERRPSARDISDKLVFLVRSVDSAISKAFGDELKVAIARFEENQRLKEATAFENAFQTKLKYFSKKSEELEKIYPSQEDSECINTLLSIGDCELEANKLDGAFEFYNKALGVGIRLHNNGDHLDIVDCLLALGRTFQAKGEPTEALRNYQEALSMLKRVLGFAQSHPIIAETLSCIGRCQAQLNDHRAARESFMNALEMKTTINGRDSAMLLATLEGLKDSFAGLKDTERERQYEEEYCRIKVTASGQRDNNQSDTLVIPDPPVNAREEPLSRLGLPPSCPDCDDPVLRYLFAELMSSHELFAFQDNTYTIKWLRELAFYFYIRKDASNSERYAIACLGMCRSLFGASDGSATMSDALLGMLRVSELRGDLQSAIEYGQKCLKMRSELRIGENHPRLTVVMETLGDYYQKMGDMTEAVNYYLTVLRKQKLYHGAKSRVLVHILTKLGDIYELLNDMRSCSKYREEASQL